MSQKVWEMIRAKDTVSTTSLLESLLDEKENSEGKEGQLVVDQTQMATLTRVDLGNYASWAVMRN
jgi:hypothetical protein